MEPLKWGPVYELGIPDLDAQHRLLLSLVNEVVAAVSEREQVRLEPVLDQLVEYAKVHFAEEERRMAAAEFPNMKAHIREHHGFQERVLELYSRYLGGDTRVALELSAFLRAWLVAHIQGSDRHYIPYLQKPRASRP